MLNNYLCTLDIGSSKISACVAVFKKKKLANIYFESLPVQGMREGSIVDSIGLIGSVGKALKNLKARSGINIKFVSVNISGQDIVTKHVHAIIPLAERGNKVITVSDMQKVNEQARILGSSLEEEIIHMIPFSYTIDSKGNISNPLGLYSHRLEVELYLVCGKLSSVQSLARVINQSGYEIKDLFFSGLATSKAVFSPGTKDGLNLFCDIGGDTTEILVFKDGLLKDIQVLPFGGDDLTRELSDSLKINFDLAEDIKRSYGIIAGGNEIGEDKEILVKKSEFYKPIKQKLVAQISQPPACHGIRFRKTVHRDCQLFDLIRQGGDRNVLNPVKDDLFIDLVADADNVILNTKFRQRLQLAFAVNNPARV